MLAGTSAEQCVTSIPPECYDQSLEDSGLIQENGILKLLYRQLAVEIVFINNIVGGNGVANVNNENVVGNNLCNCFDLQS